MRGLVRTACNWGFQLLILIVLLVIITPLAATTGGIAAGTIIMAAFFRNLFRRLTGGPNEDLELPKYTFYDTIEEFGYHFNDKGELVDDQGGRFKFVVKENDRNYNQQHYDALGELITEYLYGKMETDLHLRKIVVPVDAKQDEAQGFIFESEGAQEGTDLMVIINGAGAVRAGQWSRKLIINEDIDTGTQFPYIRRAREDGYGVIVLNTNQNQAVVNGKRVGIRGSSNAEEHGLYVWEHIISKTKATNIVIVAHSFGGTITCNIAEKFLEDFKKRVFCIVFTDSVHAPERDRWSQPVKEFMKQRAVNFASTYVPINYIMEASNPDDCQSISAGTKDHERTSHACIDSAFQFIHDNHVTWTKDGTMAPRNFLPLPEDLSEYSPAKKWERMNVDKNSSPKTEDEVSKTEKEKGVKKTPDSQDQDSTSKNRDQDPEKEKPETGMSEVQGATGPKSSDSEMTKGQVKDEGAEVSQRDVNTKDKGNEAGVADKEEKVSTEVKQAEDKTESKKEESGVESQEGEKKKEDVVSEDKPEVTSEAEQDLRETKQEALSTETKQEALSTETKQEALSTETKQEDLSAETKQEALSTETKQEDLSAETKQEDLKADMEQKDMDTGNAEGQKTEQPEADKSKKTGETEKEEVKATAEGGSGENKEETEKKEEEKAEAAIPEQTTEL